MAKKRTDKRDDGYYFLLNRLIRLLLIVVTLWCSLAFIDMYFLSAERFRPLISALRFSLLALTLPIITYTFLMHRRIAHREKYVHLILSNIQEGILVSDNAENILYQNPSAKQMFPGLRRIKDIYLNEFFYNDENNNPIPFEDRPIARALRGEVMRDLIVRLRRENRELSLLVTATPIHDRAGQIEGAVEVVHDITDFEKLEQMNRDQDQIIHTMAENISDLVGVLDTTGKIVYASPSHETILGIDHVKYVGQHARSRIHPNDVLTVQEHFQRVVNEKKGIQTEFRYIHQDGHAVLVEAHVKPVFEEDDSVKNFVVVARDITVKKRAEEILRYQNKILNSIAQGDTLEGVLRQICCGVELHLEGAICGILAVHNNDLLFVSPNLPGEFRTAIASKMSREIVQKHLRNEIIIRDISQNPEWSEICDVALRNHIRSLWSKPIFSPEGEPIGVFVMVCEEQNEPSEVEVEVYSPFAKLAGLVIQQRNAAMDIKYLAYRDPLTGLPNRRAFVQRLEDLELSSELGEECAIMMLDIDGFKSINDTFGHVLGDEVLKILSERMAACVQNTHLLCRIGGDEHTVLICEKDAKRQACIVAENIRKVVYQPISIGDHEFLVSASIGIAYYPEHGSNAQELIKNADTAMYDAKEKGHNRISIYTSDMNEKLLERSLIEKDIRRAIELEEFSLNYQPKFCVSTGRLTGAEALIRWYHPTRGPISPADFIPVAEDMGAIIPIGYWVLDTVLGQLKTWELEGKPRVPIAVNISAAQLLFSSFSEDVEKLLQHYELDSRWIELEITETALLKNEEVVSSAIHLLSKMGITITLEDFGTGYSSLSFLTRYDIDVIKVDRSFTDGLLRKDATHGNIVKAIVSLAHSIGMTVVAEGIETENQLQFLREQKCDEAQGYLFAKPLTTLEFEKLLLEHRSRFVE